MLTRRTATGLIAMACAVTTGSTVLAGPAPHSVAREWNEANLTAIRNDLARPTVHARNLYHVAVAMWDGWAVYDTVADPYLTDEFHTAGDVAAARRETISFAAYRVLAHRYQNSPGWDDTTEQLLIDTFDAVKEAGWAALTETSTVGTTPAIIGNRIAENIINFGLADGANELGVAPDFEPYGNIFYEPINDPLVPALPGNPDISDPNRWQPLALDFFVDQSGNVLLGGFPDFLSPEWGYVTPFALQPEDLTIHHRPGDAPGDDYWVYHDPGAPPLWTGLGDAGDERYHWGHEMVALWSNHLDPADGVMWDISPGGIGNAATPTVAQEQTYYNHLTGGDWGLGYATNPVLGGAYPPQMVPRGDYARILAEFWADGPDSETPPGHWFTLLNYVSDHPSTVKQIGGTGPVLGNLEWDVKTYLAMGGAMHDVAISAWGCKGWYDYARPVSSLRYLADLGQRSDPGDVASYHAGGITLYPGVIEAVTAASSAPGERHEHLAASVGKIAVNGWRGPDYIIDEMTDTAGVGWILIENWWPYQRPSFVTPPFAGYVSGHSTYSRAAADLMTLLTGSPHFPDGMGEFLCPENEFLVFEDGPSMNVTLQWASYRDASDQCSLSRIWGGIHPPADDTPGRLMGEIMGPDAFYFAKRYCEGRISCPADTNGDREIDIDDIVAVVLQFGQSGDGLDGDTNFDGTIDVDDIVDVVLAFGACP
jgi:hypothetical protein